MIRVLLTVLLASALAACATSPVARVTKLYGGDANWAAIEVPEKVTAWRVIQPGIRTYIRAPDTLGGFEIASGPVEVAPATARELASILADDGIYGWGSVKKCEFEPGVAIRFERAGRRLDLLFCFHCDELAAFEGTEQVGHEDFDVARPRLLAVMRRVFPADEEIQGLK